MVGADLWRALSASGLRSTTMMVAAVSAAEHLDADAPEAAGADDHSGGAQVIEEARPCGRRGRRSGRRRPGRPRRPAGLGVDLDHGLAPVRRSGAMPPSALRPGKKLLVQGMSSPARQ